MGQPRLWTGSPDADEPAPRVNVSESAPVVDAVSTHGQAHPAAATAAPKTAAAPAAKGDSGDGLPLGLSIAALVAGLAALGVAVLRRT